MSLLRNLISGLRALFHKEQVEHEMDEELKGYLDDAVKDKIRTGMSRHEALRAVRVEMGSVDAVKEEIRSVGWESTLESLWQDIRYGLRMLRKNPGFTVAAVLTLALGIGVITTVFSVADGILFHPLPNIEGSSQLVAIIERTKDGWWNSGIQPANFLDWQKQSRSFSSMAAYQWTSATLTGSSQTIREEAGAERVDGALVSEEFFRTLASKPELGRTFLPEEHQPGHAVVILSNRLWRSRFAANSGVVGQTIYLDGRSFVVVGVMPPKFDFPTGDALWMPLALSPEEWTARKSGHLHVIARLQPDTSVSQVRAELGAISGRLAESYPETNKDLTALPVSVGELINGNLTPVFCYTLLGAVAFLLLIACANVANLQVARATGRWREIALRSALGAGRWRVVRQLLTETALLSALGAGLGLVFAQGSIGLIVSTMPAEMAEQIAGWRAIGLNGRALAFAMAATILSALFSGLAPALRGSKIELNQALKSAGPTTSGSSLRLGSILVSAGSRSCAALGGWRRPDGERIPRHS